MKNYSESNRVRDAYRLYYNSRKEWLKKQYETIVNMEFINKSAKAEIIKALRIEIEAVRNRIYEL